MVWKRKLEKIKTMTLKNLTVLRILEGRGGRQKFFSPSQSETGPEIIISTLDSKAKTSFQKEEKKMLNLQHC